MSSGDSSNREKGRGECKEKRNRRKPWRDDREMEGGGGNWREEERRRGTEGESKSGLNDIEGMRYHTTTLTDLKHDVHLVDVLAKVSGEDMNTQK